MPLISKLLQATESVTPLSTLTKLSTIVADKELGVVTQRLIAQFIKTYKIDLNECANTNLSSYKTFNEFFIRKLKDGVRPIDNEAAVVFPTDGTIGQAGEIKAGRLIQAKGIDYSLLELLGGDRDDEKIYANKAFACIYLSPANYHRIHMPITGKLIKTIHIPGKHFPVGRKNISYLENLYTQNERLVCHFDTANGKFALIMIGAALVGSINTTWEGTIKRRKNIKIKDYQKLDYNYNKGDEIGYFKFGSTVICLWENPNYVFRSQFKSQDIVKYGQGMLELR